MSTTATPINSDNSQSHRGGPRTEAGKFIASQNSIKTALFTAGDFIRPGEENEYADLTEGLLIDLNPQGCLERGLFDEVRRAMWRLRRCGRVESNLVFAADTGGGTGRPGILDPMEADDTRAERTQRSVDRARAQANRLLKQSMAELRKIQTERQARVDIFPEGTDIVEMGLVDYPAVMKALCQQVRLSALKRKFYTAQQPTTAADSPATPAPELQTAA